LDFHHSRIQCNELLFVLEYVELNYHKLHKDPWFPVVLQNSLNQFFYKYLKKFVNKTHQFFYKFSRQIGTIT
jgi:hypothetical protein